MTTQPMQYIFGARQPVVVLPDHVSLNEVHYRREGDDLILGVDGGTRVYVRGFFAVETQPDLTDTGGEEVSGELASFLVNLSPRAVSALMAPIAPTGTINP